MNRNYLIIGGSRGIGQAICKILSENNNVYATFRNTQVSDSKIKYFHYDVENELDTSSLPDVLDGLVYCPGSIDLKPISRVMDDQLINDYKVNVIGAFKSIKSVLPRLKQGSSPSILLFSTVAVQTGFPFHSIVSASKGAIEGLTKSLAAELAPKIRVNCLAPSITKTPLADNILNTEEKITANAQRHPLKIVGEPADLAHIACFLLSEEAKWITGQIIHVDGGMSSLKV